MTDDLAQNGALVPSDRLSLIREAFRLEWLTIGWMTVEAAVAITAGITANSLVLIAFGLDSVIELASAGVLMWRLLVELRHGQKFSERAERIASHIGGGLLFILAVYITASAVWRLWNGTGEEFSWPGFIVALIAIPAMRYVSSILPKRSVARRSALMPSKPRAAVGCHSWLSLPWSPNGLSAHGGLTPLAHLRSFGSLSRKVARLGPVANANVMSSPVVRS